MSDNDLINTTFQYTPIEKWDDLDISHNLLRGIFSCGFEAPSAIQRKAILPIIDKKDVIAQAQSGTGKTAAFSIGALSQVDLTSSTTQVLILSPTHELTRQIASVMEGIGSMMDGLRIRVLVGGSSMESDIENLKNNTPHCIVGCAGRVYDMMRRNHIQSKTIKLIVLDEADEMLSSGFKDQVYNIFRYCKNDVQVALFSATLPDHIYEITSKFMRDPVKIEVKAEQLTLEGIRQYYIAVDDDNEKYENLKSLYSIISVSQCIIYCNSVKRVMDFYEAMKEDQFPVCAIHSSMEKYDREIAFAEFRTGKARVLISSNVTARGIDIQQVSIVINFDIPKDIHVYLHRIGRSGRWGRKGTGINFITRRDVFKMKEIESYYCTQIDELPENFHINK
jgi:translation initiation factor 4A